MNRRTFLGAVGSAASIGAFAYTRHDRSTVDTLAVRVWRSERAAGYDGVRERIREYLERFLDLPYWSLELSFGGTVAVAHEDGARVTTRGEWPLTLAGGLVGASDLEPVADVNLLVTDGGMVDAPTGYGLPHVASVGGARHLAALEPIDELPATASNAEDAEDVEAVDTSVDHPIVPLTTSTRTMQVLLHEVGHALGLDHDHGVVFRSGGTVVATPMLSTYAFSSSYDGDRSACGAPYPATTGRDRAITLSFSGCARRRLETYAGGVRP
ncbi:peptidase M10A and M12B matrixin and adamalysin [Halobiforma lacisalsi AJ5]|uniref:Peptidase M10A and M12B matrixin and adamalysin n=1 Tax=Natronobacterium lacisalsi AJ5 TaxID=358396 RepID=M0LCH0_NATLA|nr:hypothetical protein [Halobiforma lacisalsi]APW99249.1 peptidase M10A and M12B matrixin and adamalysin [Halobiforma lacisalsi AJ5]EMA30818.1 peptidase M10A and M12B matrixin and adamalysin [Halobiforma lacisalsi AJ5]